MRIRLGQLVVVLLFWILINIMCVENPTYAARRFYSSIAVGSRACCGHSVPIGQCFLSWCLSAMCVR